MWNIQVWHQSEMGVVRDYITDIHGVYLQYCILPTVCGGGSVIPPRG